MSNFKDLPFMQPFRYRDFRFLYLSETFFFIPTWIAAMVFGLLTTHIKGNSSLYVGLIGFAFNIPMLFGPFIGVIIDRHQRTWIMKLSALAAMVAALVMAILLMRGYPNFWLMFSMVLVYAFACAFYYPAIMTGTHDVIEDHKVIASGISLVNSNNRIMMFLGYSFAGFLVTYFSEEFTYWLNAIFFLLSLLFLMRMVMKGKIEKKETSPWQELKDGFAYVKTAQPVFAVIILLGLTGFLAWPYVFQIPVVNKYYLGGTPGTLGMILAIAGVGGIVGTFYVSARKNPLRLNRIFISTLTLMGAGLIFLGLCRSVMPASVALFIIDFCFMTTLTVGMIFIQYLIPKEYIGRIMGIVTMVSFGTVPFGSVFFYGGLGDRFGVMNAFIVAGIILVLSAIWYAIQLPKIRKYAVPIFLNKDLLESEKDIYKI